MDRGRELILRQICVPRDGGGVKAEAEPGLEDQAIAHQLTQSADRLRHLQETPLEM